MPRATAAHERLHVLAGTWVGDELLHPSPWDPQGGSARGRIEARVALGGFCLVSDYEARRGGEITMRGHGVYGYDASADEYTMHWFDDAGGGIVVPARGRWHDGELTLAHVGAHGHSRYIYRPQGERYAFSIDNSSDGRVWRPFLEAVYERCPEVADPSSSKLGR